MQNPNLGWKEGSVKPNRTNRPSASALFTKKSVGKLPKASPSGIIIDIDSQTLDMYQMNCNDRMFFAQWKGWGISTEQIANWVVSSLNNQVKIDIFPNHFLAIECDNQNLRNSLLNKGLSEFMGLGFDCWGWQTLFHPSQLNSCMVNRAISLEKIPVELRNNDFLRILGNKIGKFVEVKKSALSFFNHLLIVNMNMNIKTIEPVALCYDNLCLSLELPFYNGPFETKRPRKIPFKNTFPKSISELRIAPIRFVDGGGFSIKGFNNTSTNHLATVLCHQRSPVKTLCSPPQPLPSVIPPIGDPSLGDRNLEEGEICEWLPQKEQPDMTNMLPSCSLTPLERESSSKTSPLRNLIIPSLSKEKDNPPQDLEKASW